MQPLVLYEIVNWLRDIKRGACLCVYRSWLSKKLFCLLVKEEARSFEAIMLHDSKDVSLGKFMRSFTQTVKLKTSILGQMAKKLTFISFRRKILSMKF